MCRRRAVLLVLGGSLLSALLLVGATGCGGIGLLPVPGAEPEIRIEFWASGEVVPAGGCVVLHWEVRGAEEYPVLLNGSEVPPVGEEQVCLWEPMTYRLSVERPGGPIEEGLVIGVEGEVPAGEPPAEEAPAEVQIEFGADRTSLQAGECATLGWSVEGAEAVLLDGEMKAPSGQQEVCPPSTTTYVLSAFVGEGPPAPPVATEEVVIVMQGAAPVTPLPAASPTPPPVASATPVPPQATTPPQPTTPPPPPASPGADIRPSDLYADNEPQGTLWVRIVNDGPATVSDATVRISGSVTRSTRGKLSGEEPTVSRHNIPATEYTVNLAPGQQQNIKLDWQIDLTQYNYDVTVMVTAGDFTDPNNGNNSYSETIAPDFRVSFESGLRRCDLHCDTASLCWVVIARVENTGDATFDNAHINSGFGALGYPMNPGDPIFFPDPNSCPCDYARGTHQRLRPGETAYILGFTGDFGGRPPSGTVQHTVVLAGPGFLINQWVSVTVP